MIFYNICSFKVAVQRLRIDEGTQHCEILSRMPAVATLFSSGLLGRDLK